MGEPVFEMEDDVDPTIALEDALGQADSAAQEGDDGAAAPETHDDAAAGADPARGRDRDRNLTLAIQQEREKRKAVEASATVEREQRIRLEERMNAVIQQRQAEMQREQAAAAAAKAAAAPVDPEPNPNEDPAGHEQWQVRELQRNYQALQQQMASQQQTFQTEQQQRVVRERWQNLEQTVDRYEKAAVQRAPDYYEAFNHVRQNRINYWNALGVTDPQMLDQRLHQDRMQYLDSIAFVDQAGQLQFKQDPAVGVYNLATQLGYLPPHMRQQDQNGQAEQAQPAQRQPNQRLQNLQAGVAAAQRQGGGGRPADPGGRMTIERLNAMSEAEFAAFQDQYPGLAQELMS